MKLKKPYILILAAVLILGGAVGAFSEETDNKVDMPYFEKVLNSVRENAVWKAYYFEDTDEKPFEKVLNDLGIKNENRFVRKTQELYL